MESMYDKLGELLSGALDSGFIPRKEENSKECKSQEKINQQEDNFKKEKSLQTIPENVKEAFKKTQIPEKSTFEEAKKIYREKLLHYHPDRRNENPVLQKVAKEKTEILLENWKIIEEYYKSDF